MRAVVQDRYGPPGALQVTSRGVPEPRDDEVLVHVEAAGVDPGVWHVVTGLPYGVRLGFGLRRPRNPVPGLDLAGVVVSVGRGVRDFAPGDAVFGTGRGSYAEYAVAAAGKLAPLPACLTFEEAAAVPISGQTALAAIRKARGVAGKRVMVIGAGGGVGTFAVQIAKAQGAHVTAACSAAKVDYVRSLGADGVIDYTRSDPTCAGEFDVVIDTAGNRPLTRLRRALSPRGVLVVVGGEAGDGILLQGFDRQLRALLWSPLVRQRLVPLMATQNSADLRVLAGLIEAGGVKPVVDRVFPLHEVAAALEHISGGHARAKTVISLT
ncbi:zinc-binding dehydrogenase [Nocardioides sp. zg-579]|uniref:Zinc-binding dehydrogenase n=1 Tax=Nocardioides marmotae TaxID=2663857 RepID=A0A6I3JCC1_9ACTN|nr:zinc-binding dehydrogenase [Gordonia jinghuaiqii]MTB95784.1 zinc-binding dehydrogenase [Nocardioides marmotae]QKE02857.1 NAD(P)-dependent alcohol dehydrogenase [Nocardioides marmotae]